MTDLYYEKRKESILKATIWEFIKTGKPVSSNFLYKNYNFGIKPAMIRNELSELTNEGYLFQPHYSSARIPTDFGYEFFVKSILKEKVLNIKIDNLIINLFKKRDWKNLAKRMAEKLKVLSFITDLSSEKFVYKEGLHYLIDGLWWESKDQIKSVIQDFENLEEEICENNKILQQEKNFIKVFIGKKNPIIRNDFFSTFAGDYKINGYRILILAIGPKRINYKKVYCIFKGLKNLI